MEWFYDRVGHLSDPVILFSGAAVTGLIALALAIIARRIAFASGEAGSDTNAKLAELVHGSLLAFTVFTLALVLADVRGNLGKTLDQTLREASVLSRLDDELRLAGGPEAQSARTDLAAYVDAVAQHDWPALGRTAPSLSPEGDAALERLRASGRAAARANPDSASILNGFLAQAEDYRFGRLESATKSVTNVFWWIIFAFLVGAMAMNGRHPINGKSGALIFLHMAGIGLVLALILVMDQPFRGETSVPPDPIAQALES
jgi:hypothetical protein